MSQLIGYETKSKPDRGGMNFNGIKEKQATRIALY